MSDALFVPGPDWTELDLPYKGSRRYLHGTDLLDALLSKFYRHGSIVLRIHKLMQAQVAVRKLGSDEDASAFCAYAVFGDTPLGVASTDEPISRNVPYDEDAATHDARISASGAICADPGGFSFIERLVALNKKFLLFTQPEVSRWAFTQLDLGARPDRARTIELRAGAKLGARLVRSKVLVDGEQIGQIGFSEMPATVT